MATANAYRRINGVALIGIFAALGVMFVAAVKLSIPLSLLAMLITVLCVAIALPTNLAARQKDAEAELDVGHLGSASDQPRS